MPPKVPRCQTCKADQRWWGRFLPQSEVVLALLLSLIAVLAAVGERIAAFWSSRSDTAIHFIEARKIDDAETWAIVVGARNGGTRIAHVVAASMTFGKLELNDARLRLANKGAAVLAPNERNKELIFITSSLSTRAAGTKQTIMSALTLPVALEDDAIYVTVVIDETTRLGGTRRVRRRIRCEGSEIHAFINRYLV